MSVYLLRHGQSEDNLARIIAGHRQVQLTEKGRQQARDAANGAPEFDRIIASPLKRAHQTAIEYAQATGFEVSKVELDDRIKERAYGVLEGTSKDDVKCDDIDDTEGVESVVSVAKRIREVYDEFKDSTDRILFVTHNGPVRFMHAIVEGVEPLDVDQKRQFPNAEIIKLDII